MARQRLTTLLMEPGVNDLQEYSPTPTTTTEAPSNQDAKSRENNDQPDPLAKSRNVQEEHAGEDEDASWTDGSDDSSTSSEPSCCVCKGKGDTVSCEGSDCNERVHPHCAGKTGALVRVGKLSKVS